MTSAEVEGAFAEDLGRGTVGAVDDGGGDAGAFAAVDHDFGCGVVA